MALWKDLEAQGVKRCCAMFISGKQCRRRAVEGFKGQWCGKHGPIIDKMCDDAIKAMNEKPRREDDDED